MQGFILGSFFWGYLVTQLPGGYLADRVGGKKVYAVSMAVATAATLLVPLGARTSAYCLVFLRIITGLGEVEKMTVKLLTELDLLKPPGCTARCPLCTVVEKRPKPVSSVMNAVYICFPGCSVSLSA